jgi:hypothetical protein
MAEVMRFWFRRGVDGFRVDAIFAAIKDDRFRDNPPDRRPHPIPGLGGESGQDPLWSMNRPEVHDVIRHLRRVADEFPGRLLVGEAYVPVEELSRYLDHGGDDQFHLAFNFELLLSPWDQQHLTLAIERSEALHPAGVLPTYAISNHDQSRHATRWGPERARAAAFMLLTAARGGRPLRRRGDRHGRRRSVDPPRSPVRPRRPRRLPHPDAVGRLPHRRLHHRRAVAPARRSRGTQRGRPAVDPDIAAQPLPAPHRRAPELAAAALGEHRSFFGVAPTSSPGCARPMTSACCACSTWARRVTRSEQEWCQCRCLRAVIGLGAGGDCMRYRSSVSLPIAAILALVASLALAGVVAAAETTLVAQLSGDAETDEDGTGTATVVLDPEAGTACWEMTVEDVDPITVSHIHEGAEGEDGGVAVDLDVDGFEGSSEGCNDAADPDILQAIIDNPAGYYVNVHTDELPAGAIRGQLMAAEQPDTALPTHDTSGLLAGVLLLAAALGLGLHRWRPVSSVR